MFILALKDKEEEGAYSVEDDDGEKALYLFEDKDDAERYIGLLEADDYPQMTAVEVEDEKAIKTCELYGYHYVIITPNEFVIPPRKDDFVQTNKIS
jgi:hypothetical protein